MSRIVELFGRVCRDNPQRTAVVYREGKMVHRRSFSQLHSDVTAMAAYFQQCGVKYGDRILAFATSSYKLCVFMLAAITLGASVMYVDIWAKQESLHSVFADYRPDMLLVSQQTKHIRLLFPEINKIRHIINVDSCPDNTVLSADIPEVSEGTTALLTMTTGSTGKPKIALRSHRDLMQQLELINCNLDACAPQTVLTTSYIYVFANILNGFTTVMPKLNLGRYSERKINRLLSLFSGENITMILTSPDFCLKAENIFPQLHTLYFGGAILNLHEARKIRSRFNRCKCRIIYGSTECSIIATVALDEFISTLETEKRSLLGSVVNGVRVKLSNEGEILVTADALLESYLVSDPSTKETDESGILWHHTNDMAEEKDGRFYFLGKSRRFIHIDGRKVYSNCIEQQIVAEFPDIPKCAVLSHKGRLWAVIQQGAHDPSAVQLSDFLCRLGMRDVSIRFVKKIPCDVKHHTKINYDKLKEQLR